MTYEVTAVIGQFHVNEIKNMLYAVNAIVALVI